MPLPKQIGFPCPQCGKRNWFVSVDTWALTLTTNDDRHGLGFHPDKGILVRVAFCKNCGFGVLFRAEPKEARTPEEVARGGPV